MVKGQVVLAKYNTVKYRESRRKWYAKNAVRLRAQQKVWRAKNKGNRLAYMKEWSKRQKQWFYDYKKTLRCELCGYKRCPDALVFHHRNKEEKDFQIAVAVGNFLSKEKIMKEIKKCEVLCQNCHAELHHKIKENRNAIALVV